MSQIKSPSQPPGVESESDKSAAVKDGYGDSHRADMSSSPSNKNEDNAPKASQNPVVSQDPVPAEKKPSGVSSES